MSITQDATSLRYLPADAAECTELFVGTGIAAPGHVWRFQEPSGNIVDQIGSDDLSFPAGGQSYEQAVPGWATKAVTFSEGGGGIAFNGSVGSLATSQLLVMWVRVSATPGAERTIAGIGGGADHRYANMTTAPVYRAKENSGGTGVSGAQNPGTDVRLVAIQINLATSKFYLKTEQELIEGPWVAPAGGGHGLFIGGSVAATAAVGYLYTALWSDVDAELTPGELDVLFDVFQNGPIPQFAEGTTLAALQSGHLNYAIVAAIEGCQYLVTNHHDRDAVIDAWAGTDWEDGTAIGGLYLDLDRSQEFHPLRAFSAGGSVTLSIAPDPDDGFGVDLFGTEREPTTLLADNLDCDDNALGVKDSTEFPSTGTAYIGNECFEYGNNVGNGFGAVTRGKFSPFRTSSGGNFGRPHRAGLVSALNLNLEPVVSQHRRSWIGALAGIWIHKVDGDGLLNSRDDALCVFAGTIAESRDNSEIGNSVVEIEDILERVKGASLVRDQYRARIGEGIWIREGQEFHFEDQTSDGTSTDTKTADPLVCTLVFSSTNTIVEGFYTLSSLASHINVWLAGEKAADRIHGVYNMIAPYQVQPGDSGADAGSFRTNMQWIITGDPLVEWTLSVERHVAAFLGITEKYDATTGGGHVEWGESGVGGGYNFLFSDFAPLRWYIPDYFGVEHRIRLVDEEGIFWDNRAWLPDKISSPDPKHAPQGQNTIGVLDDDYEWGIFTLGGRPFVVAAYDKFGNFGPELKFPRRFFSHEDLNVRYEPGGDPKGVELVQIYALHAQWKEVIKAIFYSTGTEGFNHATYDVLPHTLGLSIPGELLGANFEASVDNAPEGSEWMTIIIEKPLTLEKLVNVDLILRGMHLVWRDEGLVFRQWETPIASNAVAALTEANKALPATTRGSHRTPSAVTKEWLTPIIKFMFAREWTSDTYLDGPLVLEDRTSIDDLGGQAPEKTLEARNLSKDQLKALAPLFLARMPNISRPAFKTRRTIDQRLYEVLTPGDTVTVTDGFARDPSTGERGISQVPALVVGVRYSLGGPNPANPASTTPQVGEVTLVMYPGKRFAAYCPSGQVDETASGGGFSAGYNSSSSTLRLKAHEFTEATSVLHDAGYFANGDEIEICELDPPDPANPLRWERSIASVSGDDVVLGAGLSSPAFNSTKRYRIRSQVYSAAEETQHANAYQADEVTARIEGIAGPYHYAGAVAAEPFTAETHTAPSELVPGVAFGDGVARDVGNERALIRTVNNLFDHKTARHSPVLRAGFDEQIIQDAVSLFRIIAISDKFFGRTRPGSTVGRVVKIAPRFRRSNVLGATGWVRITLCRSLPSTNTLDSNTFYQPFQTEEWSTGSTTWIDGAVEEFDLSIVGESGVGTIVVEANNAEFRGLSVCRQSERRE